MVTSPFEEFDDEEDPLYPQLSLADRSVPDDMVRRAAEVIKKSGVVEQIEVWEEGARKGPGGRPRTFPLLALFVGYVLVGRMGEAPLLTNIRDVLFCGISATMRSELGLPEPPGRGDVKGWKRVYRNVRTRFHGMLDLMDPSDRPKNRRLSHDDYLTQLNDRSVQRTDADRAEAFERLHWTVNQLLEASFLMLPRRVRRQWNGTASVDATVIPGFSRAERRGPDKQVITHPSDPDCAYYVRSADDRDDDGWPKKLDKVIWGYEATLIVCVHVRTMGDVPFPVLVVAMPPLHEPGRQPGLNAVRGLKSLNARGHPAKYLGADNNYSAAKAEDFQLPLRALGYGPVMSYRYDQLGVQAQSNGLIQVEGTWYCPSMPQILIDATKDHRDFKIDDETHAKRIEARRAYEARPNGAPDAEGHQRLLCPAAQGAPTARCPLKPKTNFVDPKDLRVRIRPSDELESHPPKCCEQETVMMAPQVGAKFWQPVPFGTPEHQALYGTTRNAVEGINAFLKDSAFEGIADPQRRRVRGVAAQSLLVAFQVVAGNLRKIDGFMKKLLTTEASQSDGRKPRLRRRTTDPIQKWLGPIGSAASGGRAPPDE